MEQTKILNKLWQIMSEVGEIEKDKKNDFQGYTYASEYIIKKTIQELLKKHKVLFMLGGSGARIEPFTSTDKSFNQKLDNITVADFEYTFYDVESGESITKTFPGAGQGRDEKGLFSAVTGAIKYIMTSTFLIPTGDDPENDGKTKPTSQPQSQGSAPPQTQKSYGDQKVDEDGIMHAMTSSKDNGYCWFCDNKRHIQNGDPIVKAPIEGKPDGVWGHRVCYFNMIAATDPKASSPDASTPPDSQGEELPF